MIQPETLISLVITTLEAQAGYQVQLLLEGEPVGAVRQISWSRWRELHAMVDLSRSHLRPGITPNPELAQPALVMVGVELFTCWLEPDWELLTQQCAPFKPKLLAILSQDSEILTLPWELLHPPGQSFLGLDSWFAIRRSTQTEEGLRRCCVLLPPPPLRLLFMASSPHNWEPFPFAEEESALRTALLLTPGVALRSVDSGAMADLRQEIERFQPHIVHIAGHAVIRAAQGYFCFEDPSGALDPHSGQEMAQELFANSTVQCVVISGRQSAAPPPVAATGTLCQGLIGPDLPMAIAWPEQLTTPGGAILVARFYQTVAAGERIDDALIVARQAVAAQSQGRPDWTLPMLYAATTQPLVLNGAARPVLPMAATETALLGRRRLLQTLYPSLRDGQIQGALLCGPAGCGKSALANLLADRLAEEGFHPLLVRATPFNPVSVARILNSVRVGLLALGESADAATLREADIPLPDRLIAMLEALARQPFVLVLDSLEHVLDGEIITDPELALLLPFLLKHLSGASRLLLVSRSPIATPDSIPVISVPPLERAAFFQMALGDARVAKRLAMGNLELETLETFYNENHPDALQINLFIKALRDGEQQTTPPPAELIPLLTPAALCAIPMTSTGLATLSTLDQEATEQALRRAEELGYLEQTPEHLWLMPNALRPLFPSFPEIHQAIGDYLLTCFEANQEEELHLDWIALLLEARGHFYHAHDLETARNITERLTLASLKQGLTLEAQRLARPFGAQ